MAQQRLDHPQVGAAGQQMRGEGVAQHMRAGAVGVDPGAGGDLLDQRESARGSDAPPPRAPGKRKREGGRPCFCAAASARSRCASQTATAARAASDSGTIRSLPPLPRTSIISGAPRSAAWGRLTSSDTRSPVA
jgi:hypothetical protein